jgi:hypothetical protein
MRPWVLTFFLLLSLTPLAAQSRIGLGGSAGTQAYESPSDRRRIVGGIDTLLEWGRLGFHPAIEFTNRTTGGRFFAYHFSGTYRVPLAEEWSLLAGAGVSFVQFGDLDPTWNAEVELDRAFRRGELFARVRYYDYDFQGFREHLTGPAGPAFSLGYRWRLTPAEAGP